MGERELTLFVGTFTTLLAIINPLEVLPVYMNLSAKADPPTRREMALKSCVYAMGLCFFFLIFGTLLMRLFGVPLSMVRIVGGIILMKIGFELFSPAPAGKTGMVPADASGDVTFVPLAMPLMFGPGAIATVLGMAARIKQSPEELWSFIAIATAIIATMFVTFLCLVYAGALQKRLGPMGIDACTRIVGFFVSAMGVGLIFDGIIEVLETHGMTSLH